MWVVVSYARFLFYGFWCSMFKAPLWVSVEQNSKMKQGKKDGRKKERTKTENKEDRMTEER